MNGTRELKTQRLLLRRYRREDAAVLHREFGVEGEMFAYSGWNPYATEEMAAQTVERFLAAYSDQSFYGWAVEEEGQLVGTVGAYDYDPETGSIEVGLSIRRDRWGRGFAAETLGRVLAYLTGEEGIREVRAWCAPENVGSRKTMLRAGMTQAGTEAGALTVGDRTYDKLLFTY